MSICNKKHRNLPEYVSLPEAQDNRKGNRHICAGCAIVEGYKDALHGIPRKTDLSHLPYSQAGTVRHKDAIAAYNDAYDFMVRKIQ